jgi:hypothetical protein
MILRTKTSANKYHSWNKSYQSATSAMLEELNNALRRMEDGRRPSMWQHQNSTGSLDSNHGSSTSYTSPNSLSMSSGYSPYQQSQSSGMSSQGYRHQSISIQQTPGIVPAAAALQTSPHQYAHQPADQQHLQTHYAGVQQAQQQYSQHSADMQSQYANGQYGQQQYPQFQQQQPVFNFNEPVPFPQSPPYTSPHGNAHPHSHNMASTHPNHQFSNWSGYGGQGGAPDTLDEENAVPPNSNPWNIDAK